MTATYLMTPEGHCWIDAVGTKLVRWNRRRYVERMEELWERKCLLGLVGERLTQTILSSTRRRYIFVESNSGRRIVFVHTYDMSYRRCIDTRLSPAI